MRMGAPFSLEPRGRSEAPSCLPMSLTTAPGLGGGAGRSAPCGGTSCGWVRRRGDLSAAGWAVSP